MKNRLLKTLIGISIMLPSLLCFSCGKSEEEQFMDNLKLQKVEDYFYTGNFNKVIDYSKTKDLLEDLKYTVPLACSSVRNGDFFGRNLDWLLNETVDFVIELDSSKDRKYASIGVVGDQDALTRQVVESGQYDDAYRVLPFLIQDGINEKGLVMNFNVVPATDLRTDLNVTKTVPTVLEKEEVLQTMLVRYVLDNFATAREAIDYLTKYVSIVDASKLGTMGYDLHYMLADEQETYLIELIGDKVVATNMTEGSDSYLAGKPYMTNFYLSYNGNTEIVSDILFDEDGRIIINLDDLPNESGVTRYGAGLERYNLIINNYENTDTFEGMRDLMKKLYYTNTYTKFDNPWYTEFVGIEVLGLPLEVSSSLERYELVIPYVAELAKNATKEDGILWQSTHSSIYDIKNKALTLYVQEGDTGYKFSFN